MASLITFSRTVKKQQQQHDINITLVIQPPCRYSRWSDEILERLNACIDVYLNENFDYIPRCPLTHCCRMSTNILTDTF